MKLIGIYLYPDLVEFRSGAALAFRNQTRFLCNYLQRTLAAQQIETDGFNKICVVCKSTPSELSYKNASNSLVAEVAFNMVEYEKLGVESLPEYFIGMLESGLLKCSRDQGLPFEYFREAIHSFRNANYKNEWVFAEKTFRSVGVKCRLRCELDISWFHLNLEVERKGEPVFSQEILRTLPDEVVYAHRFKDIKIDGRTIIIEDKFGKSFFEWELS